MKTIRWGMIGCGAVAEVKSAPGLYKARHSALLAVASRRPDRAADFARRHGIGKVWESSEQLVADPDIDAVYIATPPASHKALALLAARAGKHVYVEKPMAMRFTECQEIIDVCRENGVRLFVAFYRRAMPRFLKIKEWIETGRIGAVRCIRLVQHQPPAPEDLSRATLPWRLQPEIGGGGKFLDMGVHALDMFDFWLGRIERVAGIVSNQAGLYDVEDTVSACWQHASGVQGSASWCYVAHEFHDWVEITGSQGRIELEFFSDRPVRLISAAGVEEFSEPNPAHVQQPFIQSIVDELNGLSVCPGDPVSAMRATWVADEILQDFRETRRQNP